jgi:hypothetical protein
MTSFYVGGGLKGALLGGFLGTVLGVYSVYQQKQRRTCKHLGLADLIYLDAHDDVVECIGHVQRLLGSHARVSIKPLAVALNELIRLSQDTAHGFSKFQAARMSGRVNTLIKEIRVSQNDRADPSLHEQLEAIKGFAEDTLHNISLA